MKRDWLPDCSQVLTLLYGVYDNSPILSHTMHHLACNQDLQRTAQAEIDEVWGSQPPKSMEQLSNLRFIRACMEVTIPNTLPDLVHPLSEKA